ncbi:MAG: hypothetical protein HC921_09330 [Synechococcaceae cyanobacterium SM2_3_1]|nr:hypothetical protein [Synechococcaceae cyanobacterium SM2_3_1]
MKCSILIGISLLFATQGCSSAVAQSPTLVQEYLWTEQQTLEQIPESELIPPSPEQNFASLRLTHAGPEATTFPLLDIEDPQLSQPQWRVEGLIRYEGVEGEAYLELYSHLPEGKFFSRTLAESGPWRSITGSSSWRPVVLTFDATGGGEPGPVRPEKLEVNLVLPGAGVVEIGPLSLHNGWSDLGNHAANAWWTDPQGGLIGGLLGAGVGCVGALVGTLAGLGRSRSLVLLLVKLTMAGSGLVLLVGIYAVVIGQPSRVFYPYF